MSCVIVFMEFAVCGSYKLDFLGFEVALTFVESQVSTAHALLFGCEDGWKSFYAYKVVRVHGSEYRWFVTE